MKIKELRKVFMNGILNENPTFRLLLGMCPTLAISKAASSGWDWRPLSCWCSPIW